jgi:hypothetical protein
MLILPDEQCMTDFERVWLHFDAKYGVETLEGLFGEKGLSLKEEARILDDEEAADARGGAKRADLLKMHAYRDAIRRTAGAYVIHPGSREEKLRQYHEILPGIGAFVLFPAETGDAEGTSSLVQFIEDVLSHVASQITQHERWRYWTKEVFSEKYRVQGRSQAVPFLSRPPADTLVLLGYVKSRQHLEWVHLNRRYNLRADKRRGSVGLESSELTAEFVLLYGPGMADVELWRVSGEPEIVTQAKMFEMAYPEPSGELYYCLLLERIVTFDWPVEIFREKVEAVRAHVAPNAIPGAPITTTWLELVRSLEAPI